ncbi:hypothetical protein GXM_03091 [Nostoc sphaeroides CCNUC1]|uniref:Uncharacterized protein n=1 Tax=Nostoc sphaeroides CCNUC1 TaxID=2653204 RepID=A0A5P8VYZ5_9NOSO|nr:hypothetical protein GXM_03091 [Nostoc sphaeroides CCNUC1]
MKTNHRGAEGAEEERGRNSEFVFFRGTPKNKLFHIQVVDC